VTAGVGSSVTVISNQAVTLPKIVNLNTNKVLGRDSAGLGSPEEINVSGGLEFTGAGGIQRSALTGDITAAAGSNVTTVANVPITSIQDITTDRLLGRDTIGSGDVEVLTVGGGIEFTGIGGIQRSAITGDVTVPAGSNAATIPNDTITYAKIQNITVTDRIIGRDSVGAGDAEELQVTGGLEFTGAGGIQRSALTGDVTASAGSGATTIANSAVTLAKFQNITTDRLLGRDTAGAGVVEQLTVGGGIEFTGTVGIQRSALTGDIVASAGSNATTIPNDTVTYAKIQNVSGPGKILGRVSAGAGDIEEITATPSVSVYQNQNLKTSVRIWNGVSTTSGGVATFFPTDNNLVTGNALFTNIYAVQTTGANNTGTPINVPKTALKLISADRKTVTVNAIAGVTINILITPTEVFAADGTTVYLTIIGD